MPRFTLCSAALMTAIACVDEFDTRDVSKLDIILMISWPEHQFNLVAFLKMTTFALFGDSHIKRLQHFCDGDMADPGRVYFYGKGVLRTDRLRPTRRRKNYGIDAYDEKLMCTSSTSAGMTSQQRQSQKTSSRESSS